MTADASQRACGRCEAVGDGLAGLDQLGQALGFVLGHAPAAKPFHTAADNSGSRPAWRGLHGPPDSSANICPAPRWGRFGRKAISSRKRRFPR